MEDNVFEKTVFSFTERQSEEEVTTVFTNVLCRPALIDHLLYIIFLLMAPLILIVLLWPVGHGSTQIYIFLESLTKFGVNHCLSHHYQICWYR